MTSRAFLSTLVVSVCIMACQRTPTPTPTSTLGKADAQAPKASWLDVFHTEPASLPKSMGSVDFSSEAKEMGTIPRAYLRSKAGPITGYVEVTVKANLHADTKTLRSIEVNLPPQSLAHLTSKWGEPVEGQVDGQRDAVFWFNQKTRTQAVYEERADGAKLSYWPFIQLTTVLDRQSADPMAPIAWLGRAAQDSEKTFARRMKRRAKPGFVAWLPPLQYGTRPLSVRFDVIDGRISGASFKINTSGHPNLAQRVQELIRQTWPGEPTGIEGGLQWSSDQVKLSMVTETPGRQRPQSAVVRITAQAIQAP